MYLLIYFCDIVKCAKLYLHVTVYCSGFHFTDIINSRSMEENIWKAKKNSMFAVATSLEMCQRSVSGWPFVVEVQKASLHRFQVSFNLLLVAFSFIQVSTGQSTRTVFFRHYYQQKRESSSSSVWGLLVPQCVHTCFYRKTGEAACKQNPCNTLSKILRQQTSSLCHGQTCRGSFVVLINWHALPQQTLAEIQKRHKIPVYK